MHMQMSIHDRRRIAIHIAEEKVLSPQLRLEIGNQNSAKTESPQKCPQREEITLRVDQAGHSMRG